MITSGLGRIFPKGILVGQIVSIRKPAMGLYQYADIKPSVDFSSIEEVIVLPPGWSEQWTMENENEPVNLDSKPEESMPVQREKNIVEPEDLATDVPKKNLVNEMPEIEP